MRLTSIVFASILALTAGANIAPAQATSQTFDFTNKPSAQGLQEIAAMLRTVGSIKQLSADANASTVTVQGTSDELSMTAWIVHELDRPNAQSVPGSPQQYLVAGQSDDVIQEALTILRTVADVQKVFNYTALSDLVVRGPAAQIAVSEYLINSIDVVKGSVTAGAEYQYLVPGQGSQVARVFYLAHASTPQAVQEILTVLRTVADIQKVFNFTPLNALAIRGTANDIAACDWLIQSLDIASAPATGQSASLREYHMPGNARVGDTVRVFYPTHIDTPAGIQQTITQLRTDLQIMKVFNRSSPTALVVRGSADQIAKAELLIQDRDQLSKAKP
jgi:type II secretory pathway component GspD/PulD (secretin)